MLAVKMLEEPCSSRRRLPPWYTRLVISVQLAAGVIVSPLTVQPVGTAPEANWP